MEKVNELFGQSHTTFQAPIRRVFQITEIVAWRPALPLGVEKNLLSSESNYNYQWNSLLYECLSIVRLVR